MIFRLAHLSLFAIIAAAPVAALAQAGTTLPPAQQQNPPAAKPADDLPDSPGAAEGLEVPPAPNGPTIIMDTTMGRLTCQVFQKESPMTVANFIGLATGQKDFVDPKNAQPMHGVPFYDGTTFHRVIANFMIQGGDRRGDGTGDAGYYIGEERSPGLRFDREGRLAMANAGPGSGSTQFFITEAPQPDLNNKHTIFGQCDPHSVVIVQSIARVEKNAQDKPSIPVVINHVTIVPEGGTIPPDPLAAKPAAPAAQ